ncbi:MAG: class I SAM-dependent methyltransferase [Treponema sp.]|nr:class I SAM-dependent methyltransferase [Treponema sp.]
MLNENQYSSSKKYEARIYLNRKFKTNPVSKYEWIFERFPKKENLNVLELGCGTGLFWLANRNNMVKTWSVILSDYSEGMLETSRKNLSCLNFNFQYEIINAEDIQYPDNKFDIILANNMLYHVQNKDKTIKNISRILNDTGVFIASTMGKDNLLELNNCLYAFLESKKYNGVVRKPQFLNNSNFRFNEYSFSLNNGMEQLLRYFKNVVMEKYENKLIINEADAVINYYLSFNDMYSNFQVLPEEYIDEFKIYLENILKTDKTIITTKDEGIFICKK